MMYCHECKSLRDFTPSQLAEHKLLAHPDKSGALHPVTFDLYDHQLRWITEEARLRGMADRDELIRFLIDDERAAV